MSIPSPRTATPTTEPVSCPPEPRLHASSTIIDLTMEDDEPVTYPEDLPINLAFDELVPYFSATDTIDWWLCFTGNPYGVLGADALTSATETPANASPSSYGSDEAYVCHSGTLSTVVMASRAPSPLGVPHDVAYARPSVIVANSQYREKTGRPNTTSDGAPARLSEVAPVSGAHSIMWNSAYEGIAKLFTAARCDSDPNQRDRASEEVTAERSSPTFPSLSAVLEGALDSLLTDPSSEQPGHELSPTLRTETEGLALIFTLIMRSIYVLTLAMRSTQRYKHALLKRIDPTAKEPPLPTVTANHVRKAIRSIDKRAPCVLPPGTVPPEEMYTFLRENGRLSSPLSRVEKDLDFERRKDIYLREWERFLSNAVQRFLRPGQSYDRHTHFTSESEWHLVMFTDALSDFLLEHHEQYVPRISVPEIPISPPPTAQVSTADLPDETRQNVPPPASPNHATHPRQIPLERVVSSLLSTQRQTTPPPDEWSYRIRDKRSTNDCVN